MRKRRSKKEREQVGSCLIMRGGSRFVVEGSFDFMLALCSYLGDLIGEKNFL